MSPEQASGRAVDFRSDQFALGSILYEMATGKRAFQKATGAETLSAIIRDEPEPVERTNPRARRRSAGSSSAASRRTRTSATPRRATSRAICESIRDHLSEATRRRPARRPRRAGAAASAAGSSLAAAVSPRRLCGGPRGPSGAGTSSQPTFQRLTFQRGTVVAARFGPDGQTVYYSAAWEGGRAPDLLAATGNSGVLGARACRRRISSRFPRAGEMAVQLEPKPAVTGFALDRDARDGCRFPAARRKEVLADVTYADWAPGGRSSPSSTACRARSGSSSRSGRCCTRRRAGSREPRFSPDGKSDRVSRPSE